MPADTRGAATLDWQGRKFYVIGEETR